VAAVYFLGDISGVYWVVQFAAAVIAVGVAHVLRGPARAQEAAASEGTPLDRAA
jgi:hypothetical protein